LVIGTLNACSPAGGLLLYIDPYEFEVLSGQGIDPAVIKQSLPKTRNVRVEAAPQLTEKGQALQIFEELIERSKPDWVFLSSAHPFDPAEVIPLYPDIRFFRVGNSGESPVGMAPTNQVILVYEREQANYEAGRAIAALLGNEDFLKRIGFAAPGAEKPRVGILSAVNTEMIQRQSAAFVEGFSELADPKRIELSEIGNLTDRVKARHLLDAMREEAVAVVVLKTYVLSGFCLEYLSKETGVAVVEGPIPEQAYGETVLLALVDDFTGALERMAATMDRSPAAGTMGRVGVPVLLQWGESYRALAGSIVEEENQRGMDQQ
jgi:hypothetical protein